MIQKMVEKIKHLPPRVWEDAFIIAVIALVASVAFALGRLSVLEDQKEELRINLPPQGAVLGVEVGEVVGSRLGSTYHLPWCTGAHAIKEENKVFFATEEDAKRAGYDPAGNCKGL